MREARGLVMAVSKFCKAGPSWGWEGNQQRLSVMLTLGASCLPDPIFAAFSTYPFGFLLHQLLNCRSIDGASRLVRVFHQLVSSPSAAEVPAVLPLLFAWLTAPEKPLRADVNYPLVL